MAAKEGWQVTGQVTGQVILTDAGQPVTGTYVYILTNHGQSGSVFVPDNVYGNETTVRSMLQTKATQLDTVAKLAAGQE